MYVCLLLFHAKTTEQICIKFGTEIDYCLELHIGYHLSQYYVPVG